MVCKQDKTEIYRWCHCIFATLVIGAACTASHTSLIEQQDLDLPSLLEWSLDLSEDSKANNEKGHPNHLNARMLRFPKFVHIDLYTLNGVRLVRTTRHAYGPRLDALDRGKHPKS